MNCREKKKEEIRFDRCVKPAIGESSKQENK
jgi:hypothetical protein